MSARERILHAMARSDFVRGTYGALCSIPMVRAGIHSLVRAAIPLETRIWIRIPEGLGKGLWMYSDPRFDVGYMNGDHEPWIQELLKSELRPGDCYYDVGAHRGFFCLIASRFVGPSGKIVAFEPDPENAAVLRANNARNGITHVAVEEAALWSSVGQVTFERASDLSNRTQGRITSAADPQVIRISVPALRLDDVIFSRGYPAPQLIKMDIEGAEWGALQGARRLLNEAKPKLLCEVHEHSEMGRIGAYLQQFGYGVEEWRPVHPHYADYTQRYLWAVPSRDKTAVREGSGA
jgi:FkbM family methyltransferase